MLCYFLLVELWSVNIPLLCTRVYIAFVYKDESVSVFLVKNIIGIIFGVIEVYDCSFDYRQFCEGKGDFSEEVEKAKAPLDDIESGHNSSENKSEHSLENQCLTEHRSEQNWG